MIVVSDLQGLGMVVLSSDTEGLRVVVVLSDSKGFRVSDFEGLGVVVVLSDSKGLEVVTISKSPELSGRGKVVSSKLSDFRGPGVGELSESSMDIPVNKEEEEMLLSIFLLLFSFVLLLNFFRPYF